MNFENILDKFVSNLIVSFAYLLVVCFHSYIYFNHLTEDIILFYFPYGIITLSFLFFGNKIIFGLLLTHIIFYLIFQKYNIDLPFHNYFLMSLCQLISVPIALFVLKISNVTVGTGDKYKLDKTNIFHVLLITFYSTITLGLIIFFSSFFFNNQTNLLMFTIENFVGGSILIVLMKISVNIPNILINLVKKN